jgi:uncharacterized protein YpmB
MKKLFPQINSMAIALALALTASSAFAKLPAPSDEAKAKAAEAAAKTAHAGKVDAFLLCKSQDKVAAKVNKAKAKSATPCADPGKFVYPPPAAPATAAAAPAPAPAPAKK